MWSWYWCFFQRILIQTCFHMKMHHITYITPRVSTLSLSMQNWITLLSSHIRRTFLLYCWMQKQQSGQSNITKSWKKSHIICKKIKFLIFLLHSLYWIQFNRLVTFKTPFTVRLLSLITEFSGTIFSYPFRQWQAEIFEILVI